MFSIIPEREILKAVTDSNIDSAASKIRVSAFDKANLLRATKNVDLEIVIEGRLYEMISTRLNDNHKKVFKKLYNIDESAVGVTGYNITKAIKFISKEKRLKIESNRVIVITENTHTYDDLCENKRFKVFKPSEFIERTNKFIEIRPTYTNVQDALLTVFFI